MKKINATRDGIIEMLRKGEIVFASGTEDDFHEGKGVIWCGKRTAFFCADSRAPSVASRTYGENVTTWFVEYSEKEKPFEFQVGDVCSFGGAIGAIINITKDKNYPIKFKPSEGGGYLYFSIDGKYHLCHTEPLLKFISRPSKKVTKTVELARYTILEESGRVSQTGWRSDNCVICGKEKIIKTETKVIEYEE